MPEHGSITNLDTAEIVEFYFNPKQLSIALQANYSKVAGIGSSSQRLHYNYTANIPVPIELFMDHQMIAELFDPAIGLADIEQDITHILDDYRNFFMSLLYPVGRQDDPIRRSPPRVLFTWPDLAELYVRITQVAMQFTRFKDAGGAVQYRLPIQMETAHNERLTSGVVRKRGLRLAGYGA